MNKIFVFSILVFSASAFAQTFTLDSPGYTHGWAIDQTVSDELLDRAHEHCAEEGQERAREIETQMMTLESRLVILRGFYKCESDVRKSFAESGIKYPGPIFHETVTSKMTGWNAAYAHSNKKMFQEIGEKALLKKATAKCAPKKLLPRGSVIFDAQLVIPFTYVDLTFGYFACEEEN